MARAPGPTSPCLDPNLELHILWQRIVPLCLSFPICKAGIIPVNCQRSIVNIKLVNIRRDTCVDQLGTQHAFIKC